MLPLGYELPAAIGLVLGGLLTCFAGYRLFRLVLGLYGFILGAMLVSSMVGLNSNPFMLGGALVGGIAGAVVLVFAYVAGVALVGAALAAAIGHLLWTQYQVGDPPALAVIVVSIAGAAVAMLLQRYVIILATAFAGAWTVVIGAVNAAAARGAGREASEVWILYPTLFPEHRWATVAWILLGLVGSGVQLGRSAGRKR